MLGIEVARTRRDANWLALHDFAGLRRAGRARAGANGPVNRLNTRPPCTRAPFRLLLAIGEYASLCFPKT